jgi:hypothetical protein
MSDMSFHTMLNLRSAESNFTMLNTMQSARWRPTHTHIMLAAQTGAHVNFRRTYQQHPPNLGLPSLV